MLLRESKTVERPQMEFGAEGSTFRDQLRSRTIRVGSVPSFLTFSRWVLILFIQNSWAFV